MTKYLICDGCGAKQPYANGTSKLYPSGWLSRADRDFCAMCLTEALALLAAKHAEKAGERARTS